MTPNENSQPSRVDAVWKHMVGMFGGDAVERKYGKLPPAEWKVMISRLKEFEVDRGIRRLAYSGKPHVPSLPEFTKLCRAVADDEHDDGPQRAALPNPDTFAGDGWDIAGNMRLLKHITTALAAQSNALGEVPEIQREYKNGQFVRLKSVPSAQQVETTAILVAYKKAWSQDMREWGVNETTGEMIQPPMPAQDAAWNSCMQRARADIAEVLR